MRWEQNVEYAAKTDVGLRRQNNEDACVARLAQEYEEWEHRGHLFVVADGMGGHAVGELASKIATDTLPHTFFKNQNGDVAAALKSAVEEANTNINSRGTQNRDFQRMGTTCTSLVLCEAGIYAGHVGDSRAYRVRRDRIDQLTFDHSLQWELRRRGRLSPEDTVLQEHRNVITRSLGPESEVEVDVEGPFPVLPDDVYVICSDGLTAHVQDGEIATIVRDLKPAAACRLLVHLANLRGGTDNCTVIVTRIGPLPANVPAPEVYVTPEEPVPDLNWKWIMAFWLVAGLMVSGGTLWLFSHARPGAWMSVIGAIIGIGLLVAARRTRASLVEEHEVSTAGNKKTSGPYRSAIARPVEELLDELAQAGAEIQRTAREDDWNVDWESHEQAVQKAREALANKRRGMALREYAKAIDALMSGIQVQQRVKAGPA